MTKKISSRPNLDHLRNEAKSLLAALRSGDGAAARTFQEHLPAAKGKSVADILAAGYRLADAQSAVARKSGFDAWPQIARHVEQLRALEGTWTFATLEVDGSPVPLEVMRGSTICIDGDRFRTDSPGAVYEGEFNINVEAEPHEIDIEFVEGPEKGNWNRGIFRLTANALEICLNTTGGARPREFATKPGTGHAYEVLRRASAARPAGVTGGRRESGEAGPVAASPPAMPADAAEFNYVETALLNRMRGTWAATRLVLDGKEMPAFLVKSGRRTGDRNEVKVEFGGGVVVHALVRYDESANPVAVDYLGLGGPTKGQVQRGIMEFRGEEAYFCMAPPGHPRPTQFESKPGSGWTLSQWERAR